MGGRGWVGESGLRREWAGVGGRERRLGVVEREGDDDDGVEVVGLHLGPDLVPIYLYILYINIYI